MYSFVLISGSANCVVSGFSAAGISRREEADGFSLTAFKVLVSVPDLNIRSGPGTNYAATGRFTGAGVFTITAVQSGQGSDSGWGKLKSGAGWIALDYAKRV